MIADDGRIEVIHNHFLANGDALSFESGRGLVRHNRFERNTDDGIDMDEASEAIIEDNVIRDNKDDGIEIRLHKYRGKRLEIVIRRNVFSGNREDGLQLINFPDRSDRTFLIERNLFIKNAMAAIGCMSDGNSKENYKGADLPEPIFIIDNTFINSHYGIIGGGNMVLLNNVIVETAKVALKRIHGDSVAGVNLLWNNNEDTLGCDLNTDRFLMRDPLLDEDHTPRPGSPCLDAGTGSLEYNGKMFTIPAGSYSGTAPDLGMFEER